MLETTLVILNPKAGGGRAGRLWGRLEPLMYAEFGDLTVAITQHPAHVHEHLHIAQETGTRRVVAVGGDGTNHALLNALLAMRAKPTDPPPMTFGHLPIGTGQDFARVLGIPRKPEEAVRWLARATPQPIDIGRLQVDDHTSYFMNICSAGVSGRVAQLVEDVPRRVYTFWWAAVRSFLSYKPQAVRIWVDGALWYEGGTWLLSVANGTTFGRGMRIAPHARVDDGLFDVVLVKDASMLRMLRSFNHVYKGTHLALDPVESTRGQEIIIESQDDAPLLGEIDGEPIRGRRLTLGVQPGVLYMLQGV